MRPWIVSSVCAVTLFMLTGMMIGQQQGPIGSPGSTVAKPRKSSEPDKSDEPAELPKIPSKLKKDPAKTAQLIRAWIAADIEAAKEARRG